MKRTGSQNPDELMAFLDWVDAQIDLFKAGYEGSVTLRASELRAAARRGIVVTCDFCGEACSEPHRSAGGILLLCLSCSITE